MLLIREFGDMNTSLGRNGLIGLAVGASAAFGFIAFIIYREMKSRKAQRMTLQPRPASHLLDVTDGVALLRDTHDAQGGFSLSHHPRKKRVRLCVSNANLSYVVTPQVTLSGACAQALNSTDLSNVTDVKIPFYPKH